MKDESDRRNWGLIARWLRDWSIGHRARAHLAAIVLNSDDAIISKDLDGIIQSWNPGAERLFGYRAEEAVGEPIVMLIPPDRLHEEREILTRLRRGEHVDHFETQRVRKDGAVLDVSITISPVRDVDGNIIGASKIARDITEKKRADAALARANERLRRQQEEMERFVYSVSHDLKAPLITISGMIGILRQDLEAGRVAEAKEVAERAGRAAERTQRLIADLLEFARLGSVEDKPRVVDVAQIAAQIAADLRQQAADAGASIRIAPDLPTLRIDPDRLAQALENLLTNALKYGCEGPDKRVEVASRLSAHEVQICVRDHGPGIPPEHHQAVFELFRRLHADDRGTGVGLAIVHRIAELHGGRCWVESQPGHGAAFWIAFPRTLIA